MAQVVTILKGSLIAPAAFVFNSDDPGVIVLGFASITGISGDGEVAVVELIIVGTKGMTSALTLTEVEATDSAGTLLGIGVVDGQLTVEDRIRGDGNGDGKITVLDALIALKMFVGSLPEDLTLDMNGDGRVTPEDARQILVLAKPTSGGPS